MVCASLLYAIAYKKSTMQIFSCKSNLQLAYEIVVYNTKNVMIGF